MMNITDNAVFLKTIALFFIIPMFFLLLFACSHIQKLKKQSFKIESAVLAKGIKDERTMAHPLWVSQRFSVLDSEIYSYIRIKNIAGNHMIRWEWINPDGALYHATKSASIKTTDGNYSEYATVWHKLPVHGKKSAQNPGEWTVKIYLDEALLTSRSFVISDIDVDKLPATVHPSDPAKFGLIIGVENYSRRMPKADYALRDSRLFKEYLINIMGVPLKNIIVLEDTDATLASIRSKLKSYLPNTLPRSATLYVYFSGHGDSVEKSSETSKDNTADSYLVAYDGDPLDIVNTGYNIKSFYQDLNNLNIKQTLVFIDSCFSGNAAYKMSPVMISPKRSMSSEINLEKDKNLNRMDKVISLNSSTGNQFSLPYDDKQHGLFSYYLFKGLYGRADADGNRNVSLYELCNYIRENVDQASRRMNRKQTPVVIPELNIVKDINICTVSR